MSPREVEPHSIIGNPAVSGVPFTPYISLKMMNRCISIMVMDLTVFCADVLFLKGHPSIMTFSLISSRIKERKNIRALFLYDVKNYDMDTSMARYP